MAQRRILDPEYANRLAAACDAHSHCPPLHSGRLVWVAGQLKAKFGQSVSNESVRKWFYGESRPKQEKSLMLAEVLGVDPAWLQMGIDPTMQPRERKVRNAMVEGVVNVIAGLIQMDGGHPAFPENEGTTDIHAIIRGAKYDFHVSLADPEGVFHVPAVHDSVIVLGVVRAGFSFQVYEIPAETIDQGKRKGGSIDVSPDINTLKQVESFAQRI